MSPEYKIIVNDRDVILSYYEGNIIEVYKECRLHYTNSRVDIWTLYNKDVPSVQMTSFDSSHVVVFYNKH